ncbi:hypothetical protein AB6A40_003625 [Gnathostoma spinigerum]|uniref:Uncharacterized protein n=1 Tax=Gnathostoma spinigerum TaxID=75299 RepID=A0ABD6EHQ4_9BILA
MALLPIVLENAPRETSSDRSAVQNRLDQTYFVKRFDDHSGFRSNFNTSLIQFDMIFSLVLGFFVVVVVRSAPSSSVNPCYFAFREESAPGSTCSSSNECTSVAESQCIYSVLLRKNICCSSKAGAVQPVCPGGSQPMDGVLWVLCRIGSSDDCPIGYSCQSSLTDFTKNPGDSNTICCPQ